VALDFTKKKWWETDEYSQEAAIPIQFEGQDLFGPKGVALVKAYLDGSTQKGWGLNPPKGETNGFMPRYLRGDFLERRALHRYEGGDGPFAFVMRSARIIVVDIDGKKEGLEHVVELGMLPPTLAETSKSGNGYHLWYITDETWDDKLGFAGVNDSIGIVQGVDIRAVGCIYHHDTQRWNMRALAPVPTGLWQRLKEKQVARAQAQVAIQTVLIQGDDLEIMMLQDSLTDELAKPLKQGSRNTHLFAIGNKMRMAGISGWDEKVRDRALEVGLPADEVERLLANINKQP
jgi:Bifunctional DNA primase/polymerase, N-terminal